jgi:hypothetical protein
MMRKKAGAEPGSNRAEQKPPPVINHTHRSRSNRHLPLNSVIGTDQLCAWQPVTHITWVQTRSPQFARKLLQRQDARLVMRGVVGGYLRTFEFWHGLAWAQRLVGRYTRNRKATNARKIHAALPANGLSNGPGRPGGPIAKAMKPVANQES